ncbi:hypothetical protein PFISCL1PPCAC_9598, partial [Pristionchus fissidentatus]
VESLPVEKIEIIQVSFIKCFYNCKHVLILEVPWPPEIVRQMTSGLAFWRTEICPIVKDLMLPLDRIIINERLFGHIYFHILESHFQLIIEGNLRNGIEMTPLPEGSNAITHKWWHNSFNTHMEESDIYHEYYLLD